MGNKVSIFTDVELKTYQDCTFFSRSDVLRLFKKFTNLVPEQRRDVRDGRLPRDVLEEMSELKENPFRRRICQIFSEDGTGDLTFDEFLDLCSVFSEAAPPDVKIAYAFKIYDFDEDNHIGTSDLEKTIRCLTKDSMTREEIDLIINKVLEETDLDDDQMLSFIEFEHVISRAPEFLSTFHIRI